MRNHRWARCRRILNFLSAACFILFLGACLPPDLSIQSVSGSAPTDVPLSTPTLNSTTQPVRPVYQPGELVDYTAQAGDTLVALAAHFNTTVQEIRAANSFIPPDVTTMPPGMPMKIPIYYEALWGSSYQIIPDSLFVNGPAVVGFDPVSYVSGQPGWFKGYTDYVLDRDRQGGEIVSYVSTNYSISPRLLLVLIDYQLKALSDENIPQNARDGYLLGEVNTSATGVYRQLAWAANTLNNAYYDWRSGKLREFYLSNGQLVRPDPWQNAASVALQYYFSRHLSAVDYQKAISPDGFAANYRRLFGDPWTAPPHIPGSLRQPAFRLPFQPGAIWAFTGGPHNPWGNDSPLAALDFAPPLMQGGCTQTEEFATAVADGVIVRTGLGIVVLDLDGDGDEHTGWDIFYLHVADKDKVSVGTRVKAGDPIGHPSCEGGEATGTHIHIARKYNGEWILADGPLAFNFEGWVSSNGSAPYLGYLKRNGLTVSACVCSDKSSQLQSDFR
jgi:LasA protease